MITGWFKRRAADTSIEQSDWLALCAQLPFLARLDLEVAQRTRRLAARFLATKAINGAGGLELDDAMRLSIAVQACLPVNRLDLHWYDAFEEVVVYPDEFVVDREDVDEAGVVTQWREPLSGEALPGGPVVLSWADVMGASHGAGDQQGTVAYNVVIHEFAHKLDLADGKADGCPPLPAPARVRWLGVLHAAFEAFNRMIDEVEDSIPADMDPESEDAAPYWATLPLDPYAATDPAEFFAVASEAYFVAPQQLAAVWPDLHSELRQLYG
jgi:hypothetical protein